MPRYLAMHVVCQAAICKLHLQQALGGNTQYACLPTLCSIAK